MVVKLKSNGQKIKITKASWEKYTPDQKMRYEVIDPNDSIEKGSQTVVTNEVVKKK